MALVRHETAAAPVTTVDYSLLASIPSEESYRVVYDLMFSRLVSFASRFLPVQDAEDVVQEAMTEMWERWQSVVGQRPSTAYYCRAVRNRIANKRRSEHRESKRLGAFLYRVTRRSARKAQPDAELEREELEVLIDITINSLPERNREAWSLVREHGLTYAAAAEAMGVATVSAKKYMTRAQKVLRETLSKAGYDEAALRERLAAVAAEGADDLPIVWRLSAGDTTGGKND